MGLVGRSLLRTETSYPCSSYPGECQKSIVVIAFE